MKSLNIFFLLLPVWLTAQTTFQLPPGECYESCLIPDVYKIHEIELPVFTGNPNNQHIERYWRTIETEPGLEERVMVVKDLYHVDSYELRKYKMTILVKKGGHEEERKVLCPEQLTEEVLLQILQELAGGNYLPKGYEAGEDFEQEILNALMDYQTFHHLPIGHFDLETLKSMGFRF